MLYRTWFTTSSHCSIGVESAEYKVPCTTVTNFCSEGKVMLSLQVWFAIKFCFVLDTCDTDAIAINKLCALNFRNFTMYLTIRQQ